MRRPSIALTLLSVSLPLALLAGCGSQNSPLSESDIANDIGNVGDKGTAITTPVIPTGTDSTASSDSSATVHRDSASTDTALVPVIPPVVDNVPVIPPVVDNVPVIPPVVDNVPVIPPVVDNVPVIPPVVDNIPVIPPVVDNVPVIPPVVDNVPVIPPVVDNVPVIPPVVDNVPVIPPVVDNVPVIPPVVDNVPSIPPLDPKSRNAALAARMGVPVASILLNTDLEGEDPACWGNRVSGFNRAGCGQFKSIGSFPLALSSGGIAHSGSKALRITYATNEEAGGSNVGVYADTVNVRAYYLFDQGFDFGQGMKIGRVQSFNSQSQMNDVDVILQCRSVNGANQCGVTDMYQLGLHYNGRPLGSDWGAVSADVSFQRGRWYAVEYQVILNTPGVSDGIGRMWVDGKLVGERKNLRIRGSFGTNVKLNTVRVGGWYSNGGGGNSCANPSQPSRIYMDDVVIAKGYIGTEPSGI